MAKAGQSWANWLLKLDQWLAAKANATVRTCQRMGPARFTAVTVLVSVGVGVASFNMLYEQKFLTAPPLGQPPRSQDCTQLSSERFIPRIAQQELELARAARKQEQDLIDMLIGLRGKSRAEKLEAARTAMEAFMIGSPPTQSPAGSETAKTEQREDFEFAEFEDPGFERAAGFEDVGFERASGFENEGFKHASFERADVERAGVGRL